MSFLLPVGSMQCHCCAARLSRSACGTSRLRDAIDVGDQVWTIPATRMKAQREQRIPLSGRAVEVLGLPYQFVLHSYSLLPIRHGAFPICLAWSISLTAFAFQTMPS